MRTRWVIAAGTAALLVASSGAALAQGRGHGRGRGNQGEPPGQAKKAERAEARFDDRDRELAHNWYVHERRGRGDENEARELPPGLRNRDRLPPGWERKLRAGWVVDEDMRRDIYPAPVALVRVFPPPPPGFRYVVLSGHLLLLDAGFRVADFIRLDINLAR